MSIESPIIQAIKDWWRNLPNYLRFGSRPKPNAYDVDIESSISDIVSSAIWSSHYTIDIVLDVLSWINNNLEELLTEDSVEVNVIIGDTLKNFIEECQHNNQYRDIPNYILTCLSNSVVLIAMDEYGNITGDQMIRSYGGLSDESKAKFNNQPILKIKIPV